jgi:hypothetical protein
MTFRTPVDICNRAAQHCGVRHIQDFTEDSVQASEFAFNYDKLRRAELRRNVWVFATRKAAIRPVSVGTMFLSPTLWASTVTYGYGAVVSDVSGFLWQSIAQDNLNNAPGNSYAWEAYFGPLSVQPYDGSTGYFAGELVYETPGDGTYLVYLSLLSGNTQDPRAPTEWSAATQYAKDAVVLYYAPWATGTTYAAGDTISYNGADYVSLAAANLGNQPDTSLTWWAKTSATIAPAYYNSAAAYPPGTFVTYLGVNYVCILASTGNAPSSSPTYWVAQAAGTTYASLIDFNLNNDPSLAPAIWSPTTTYAIGNKVGASDGNIYVSLVNTNLNQDPTQAPAAWSNTSVLNPWTTVNSFGKAAVQWAQVSVMLSDLTITYPLGSGPAYQTQTRNLYRLPANFLRKAPQDPKAGSVSFLGAPTGIMYDDWEIDGQYIVSREVFPIILRFVGDVTDVTAMDDMFCEGLAARIATETVERLTQSTTKMAGIVARYKEVMTEARLVNGIDTGATEPPEDDWVTARI